MQSCLTILPNYSADELVTAKPGIGGPRYRIKYRSISGIKTATIHQEYKTVERFTRIFESEIAWRT